MLNALTIEVEDYFQAHAFSKVIKCEDWEGYECRIERNTDRVLEILDSVRGNFSSEPLNRSAAALNNSLNHSLINSASDNIKFIAEFPISTVRLLGQNLPISGGGYFRLFPYSVIEKGLKSINEEENKPFIF